MIKKLLLLDSLELEKKSPHRILAETIFNSYALRRYYLGACVSNPLSKVFPDAVSAMWLFDPSRVLVMICSYVGFSNLEINLYQTRTHTGICIYEWGEEMLMIVPQIDKFLEHFKFCRETPHASRLPREKLKLIQLDKFILSFGRILQMRNRSH
jgi:hypothetical protein